MAMVKKEVCSSIAVNKRCPDTQFWRPNVKKKKKNKSPMKAVNLNRVIYRVSQETPNQINTHIPTHTKPLYAIQPDKFALP